MTEDLIERQVERRFNSLDARLMSGELSQAEYDEASTAIARDAERAYTAIARDAERAYTDAAARNAQRREVRAMSRQR